MPLADVETYLNGEFARVQGWCIPHLWQSLQPMREAILNAGATGPVAEIGVYHGKFFIGLVKTMAAARANYAIDVFDLQQFNLDKAGAGSLARFKENLQRSGVADSSVEFLRTDSMWLNRADSERIRAESGGFSMFSIDGCHLAEHTINDLHFAMEVTLPHGIIFIDDYYNADWPGVHEGIAKFYLNQPARFVPLYYSCNKLVLCNLSYHKIYLDAVGAFVKGNYPETRVKPVKRFGFDTLTITPNYQSRSYLVTKS
jgi:hypothetical protein